MLVTYFLLTSVFDVWAQEKDNVSDADFLGKEDIRTLQTSTFHTSSSFTFQICLFLSAAEKWRQINLATYFLQEQRFRSITRRDSLLRMFYSVR